MSEEPPRSFEIPIELGGRLLDAAVKTLWNVTWGEARKWIETGKIKLDGQVVTDPTKKARPKGTLELDLRARRPRAQTDLDPSRIVHADAQVIVVDKPSGMSTVPFEEHETGTLEDRVRAWLASQSQRKGQAPPNLGVVHRIDAETSGLLVFTRTWTAKQSLSGQFRAHTVHRRYLAIAHGTVPARRIESHLLEDRGDGLRGSWEARPRKGKPTGQRAVTHVTPLEVLPGGATLVECRLETGRTHQIRIHLSELGHPLVGERVYVRNYRAPLLPAPRLMLHAQQLGFVHPTQEREVRFERAPPDDFTQTLQRLRAG
jgi:23S rRNA pseudouridine1911/1915/1917 synthase